MFDSLCDTGNQQSLLILPGCCLLSGSGLRILRRKKKAAHLRSSVPALACWRTRFMSSRCSTEARVPSWGTMAVKRDHQPFVSSDSVPISTSLHVAGLPNIEPWTSYSTEGGQCCGATPGITCRSWEDSNSQCDEWEACGLTTRPRELDGPV